MPLLGNGHRVEVINTSLRIKFLYDVCIFLFSKKTDLMIIIGGFGPKQLVLSYICRLKKLPMIVRMGGNRVRDLESMAFSFKKNHEYFKWLKFLAHSKIAKVFMKKIKVAFVVNASLSKLFHDRNVKIHTVPQFCEGNVQTKTYTLGSTVRITTISNLKFYEKAQGVIWLIHAVIRYASKTGRKIKFKIAGDGVHLKKIKQSLNSIDLPQNLSIKLLGFVLNVNDLYEKTDILLYHSTHDATPNVILESKRFSLPILINRCVEFESLVKDRTSGLLYSNQEEFNNKLDELIKDCSLREFLGKNSANDFKERFSFFAVKNTLEKALHSMLGKL